MQIAYLKTFAAAADLKSFTRAAEVCSLSQPAVSQQMKELENHFGHELFDRSSRNLSLTAAGVRLRAHVARVLAQLKSAREELDEIGGQPSGALAVGAGNTIGIYLLPLILGEFRRAYPLVQLSIRVGSVADLMQALSWKEIDLALVEEEIPRSRLKDLAQTPYGDDEIVLIAPPGHRLARRSRIGVTDLLDVPLVLRQRSSATRALILRKLEDAGLDTSRLKINLEVGNTEALKRCVQADLGLAFVSRFAIQQELEFGLLRVVAISGVQIRRKLWLLAPEVEQPTERLERFSDFIRRNPPVLAALLTAMTLSMGAAAVPPDPASIERSSVWVNDAADPAPKTRKAKFNQP